MLKERLKFKMNFRDAREWNEKKKCSVPNCFNNRDGISKYCKKHKLKAI